MVQSIEKMSDKGIDEIQGIDQENYSTAWVRVRDRNNDRNSGTTRERTERKGKHEGNGFEPERRHEMKREGEYTEKPCASTANDGGNRETEGRDARDRESRRRTNRKRVKRGTKETRLREKVAKWEIRHSTPP